MADTVGGARAMLVDSLLLGLLLAFLVAAWWELRRNSVLIEPIDVPKDLAEKGYTAHVIAQRLAAEISALQRAARLRARLEEGFELSSAQIDFAVPAAGISYRAIIRYVRQLLRLPEERVQDELVREAGTIRAVRGELVPAEVIRLMLRTRDGYQTPGDLQVTSETELPQLFERAARELAWLVAPSLMVTYWFWVEQRERKFEQTFAAVHRCLTRTPADRHHHAYVIWGNALVVQRQFNEADQKYRAAAALAPRFASTYNSW
jgi:hypothetical protein